MAEALAHTVHGGGSRTIVLLHPIAMRQAFWDPVVRALENEAELVTVDLRGHGANRGRVGPFGLDDLAEDVAETLAALGRGPALVVGCSLGGMVAQGLLANHSHLLAGAVLADTAHTMGTEGAAIMRSRAEKSRLGLDHTVEADLARWFSPSFRAAHPETVGRARAWVLDNEGETIALGWEAIAGLCYERALAETRVPVLVVTGEEDAASPPRQARATAAAIARARYAEIAGAGHFAPLEKPEAFAALIRDFMDGLAPGIGQGTARAII